MCSSASRAAMATPRGSAITPYIQFCTRSSMHNLARLHRLGMHRREVRNLRVPLEQRPRLVAESIDRVRVKRPHFVDHRTDVRVDDVCAVIRMTSEVILRDGAARNGVDVRLRIEAVVVRADVDVVDIEKQLASGQLDEAREKVP